MFFYVKYIDYEDFQKTEDLESLASELSEVFPKQNKELLVNPDCFIGIILDHIYDAAGIEEDIRRDFDLANERAKVLNINTYPPDHNALDIFTERATYYIVYCDKERNKVRPLLSISSTEYLIFVDYQRRRSSLSKRRRSGSKASHQSLTKGKKASVVRSLKSAPSKSKATP